jgi:Hsp70 protein
LCNAFGEKQAFSITDVELAARTKACVLQVLEDAQLQRLDIDRVLLVGGSTRIPAIRSILQEYFGNRVELNQEVRMMHRLGTLCNAGHVWPNESIISSQHCVYGSCKIDAVSSGAVYQLATW